MRCMANRNGTRANMKQLYFISIFQPLSLALCSSRSLCLLSRLNKIQIKIKCFPYILNAKRNRASLKRSHPVAAHHCGAKSAKMWHDIKNFEPKEAKKFRHVTEN